MNTEETPRVSVIVPVYNVSRLLSRCVESLLRQDMDDWELILVDDGSSDGSGEICDHYAARDRRIVVRHKANEGVSVARNTGMAIARAEWVCFVDSDDWVEPGYLSGMLQYASDTDTVVYGTLMHDYEDGSPSSAGCHFTDGDSCDLTSQEEAAPFMVRNRIAENGYPFAKIFNKKILANGEGFNPAISYHEDHVFVLDYLLKARRIVLSADSNYHYVHRSGGISLSKKTHPAANMVIASEELLRGVTAVTARFSIADQPHVRRLYTMLGLNQLVGAALHSSSQEDVRLVGDAVRKNREWFERYYYPNHRYVRFIPWLYFRKLDKIVLWLSRLAGRII